MASMLIVSGHTINLIIKKLAQFRGKLESLKKLVSLGIKKYIVPLVDCEDNIELYAYAVENYYERMEEYRKQQAEKEHKARLAALQKGQTQLNHTATDDQIWEIFKQQTGNWFEQYRFTPKNVLCATVRALLKCDDPRMLRGSWWLHANDSNYEIAEGFIMLENMQEDYGLDEFGLACIRKTVDKIFHNLLPVVRDTSYKGFAKNRN